MLRFRISQNDKWLLALAFVYGLGVTSNWALIGFFPLFLFALIWIKGLSFFNFRFVALMSLCGVAGLSLYLLAPAMGSLGATTTISGACFARNWARKATLSD